MRIFALLACCTALALAAGSADAAFPGRNGKIVFVRQTHGPGGTLDVAPAIFVVNPDYTGLRALTDPVRGAFDTSPAWSPDGKRLAFVRLVSGVPSHADGHEIHVMDADGTHVRRLTRNSAYEDHPAWSPDGKWIAFTRRGRAGPELTDVNYDIWLMHADGTGARQLTKSRDDEVDPAWSPDGKEIAFLADAAASPGGRIMVVSAAGSKRRLVVRVPLLDSSPFEAYSLRRPSWAPDGRRIAFVGSKGITTVRTDGKAPVVLPFGLHPTWSPDGKNLTFVRYDEQYPIGRIYVMDAKGRNLRALTSAMYPLDDQQPDWQPVGTLGNGGSGP